MTKRFDVKFPLASGRLEKRTAYIYLPESYLENPEKEPDFEEKIASAFSYLSNNGYKSYFFEKLI